jgi:hypothetical protein
LSREGERLDPPGFIFPPQNWFVSGASVAFGGSNYIMGWREGWGAGDIYCVRINTDGTVLDSEPIVLEASSGRGAAEAIAFDGENYIVSWQDHSLGSPQIYYNRVSTEGIVSEPEGIPLTNSGLREFTPTVTPGDAGQLLVT